MDLKKIKQEEGHFAVDTTKVGKNEYQQPGGTGEPNTNADWERKIIRTATLTIEAADYNKYYNAVYEAVKRSGGYISQENQSQSDYKKENVLSIKIPVLQFDAAIALLINGTGHEELIVKTISSDDVTGQVVDTKSRLESKRQVREKYLDLLKQAKNMKDVLLVQNEINDLQEQIEMATGRISYLNQSASYSTINLTFFQVLDSSIRIDEEPTFVKRVVAALQTGWDLIQYVLVALTTIWPILLAAGFLWFALRRYRLSKQRKA